VTAGALQPQSTGSVTLCPMESLLPSFPP